MANGAGRRNVRTRDFRSQFDQLPGRIQRLAVAAFELFRANPAHPSLRLHDLGDNKRGQHREGSRSVSINMQYRAIYVVDGDRNVWYWIGTHADHDTFAGK